MAWSGSSASTNSMPHNPGSPEGCRCGGPEQHPTNGHPHVEAQPADNRLLLDGSFWQPGKTPLRRSRATPHKWILTCGGAARMDPEPASPGGGGAPGPVHWHLRVHELGKTAVPEQRKGVPVPIGLPSEIPFLTLALTTSLDAGERERNLEHSMVLISAASARHTGRSTRRGGRSRSLARGPPSAAQLPPSKSAYQRRCSPTGCSLRLELVNA